MQAGSAGTKSFIAKSQRHQRPVLAAWAEMCFRFWLKESEAARRHISVEWASRGVLRQSGGRRTALGMGPEPS